MRAVIELSQVRGTLVANAMESPSAMDGALLRRFMVPLNSR
jgi:hypothetical protein